MKFKYRMTRTRDGYQAQLLVPLTATQAVVFTGDASIRDTAAALKSMNVEGEVGSLFGGLGRGVAKLTKSKALRKAVGGAVKVLDNPLVQGTLMAVNPALGTGVMTGVQALKAGEKILNQAQNAPKGSRERIQARAAVRMMNNAAKSGAKLPPKAAKAVKYVAMVTQG